MKSEHYKMHSTKLSMVQVFEDNCNDNLMVSINFFVQFG